MSDMARGGDAEKDEMDHYGYPQLDPEHAERLLDDLPAADAARMTGAGGDPLVRLLTAAAAPGRPAELAGQDAALAAFRAGAAAGPVRSAGRVRRLLALKIGALTAALAIGGVAVAAGAGLVPGPFDDDKQPTPTRSSSRSSTGTTPTGAGTPSTSAAGEPSASPAGVAPAALIGLCRAYLAAAPANRGQALTKSELSQLSTYAGGPEAVEGRCQALIAGEKPARPSKAPHATGQPSADPRSLNEPATPPSHPVAPSPARS